MVEVLKGSFEKEFPRIVDAIRRSQFVAIDAEFTGLDADFLNKKSLFDSPNQRYEKLRKSATSFIICQIGLAAFIKDVQATNNRYDVQAYNFYVCPRSQGIQEPLFTFQASSIEFLCQHSFDFNKFAYEGVSYLRSDLETDLRRSLSNNTLFGCIERDSYHNSFVQSCCSEVSSWLSSDPREGEQMTLNGERCIANYIIHKELRSRYQEIWTIPVDDNKIMVQKVSALERKEFELGDHALDDRLVDDFLGFTRVLRALIDEKKPVVGHNLLCDLLLIYNQFYKPLPRSHAEFKNEITRLFPAIYDTKHIAYAVRKKYEKYGIVQSSVLKDLHDSLDSHKGRFQVLFSPEISHADGFDRYESSKPFHEAGFDAYLAGYVFLRFAHMNALHDEPVENHRAMPFRVMLNSMEPFCNKVNLIRANNGFLNLQGDDPSTNRPRWLVVESKSEETIDPTDIVELCSRHGSVDVKLLDRHRVLVATMNYVTDRAIVKAFKGNREISVARYSLVQHSRLFRSCLWLGATTSFAVGLRLLCAVFRQLRSL